MAHYLHSQSGLRFTEAAPMQGEEAPMEKHRWRSTHTHTHTHIHIHTHIHTHTSYFIPPMHLVELLLFPPPSKQKHTHRRRFNVRICVSHNTLTSLTKTKTKKKRHSTHRLSFPSTPALAWTAT